MSGTLYGIGTGPGEYELLTLKAVRLIKECDVISIAVTDRSLKDAIFVLGKEAKENKEYIEYKEKCAAYQTVLQGMPEIEDKDILYLPTKMTKDILELTKEYEKDSMKIMELLDQGKNIAFITLGDPTIYATYIYVHKLVEKNGYKTQIVSGIPSFCAVAARMNTSLVERNEQLHVIPGSYDIEEALKLRGTKVLMKIASKMPYVKQYVKEHHNNMVMVENCGRKEEKVYKSCEEIKEPTGYYSLMIIKEDK